MRLPTTLLAIAGLCAGLAATVHGADGKPATLPLKVVADGLAQLPWIPSGYMGDTGAVKMEDGCTDNPKSGNTCLKVSFNKNDGWAGVVWQDPANDWGDKAGGWNLTGAKKLAFWARGAEGGEKVKFVFGLIGADKPNHDSGKGEAELVLGKEWKEFSIDVADKDLKTIKTGFCWVVGGQGKPVVFYLDDVRWE